MAQIDPALSCFLEHCDRRRHQKGMCTMHYTRLVREGNVGPPLPYSQLPKPPCSVEFCTRVSYAKGLCTPHYHRKKRGQDLAPPVAKQNSWGCSRYVDTYGYVFVSRLDGKGVMREHHLVMQEKIGRELFPGENVHHINGIRDDNRPENLELWISSQPSGQRVQDLLDWAKTILDRYEGTN